MPKISFECLNCGKRGEVYRGKSQGKFCSSQCYHEYIANLLFEKVCRTCGHMFMGKRQQVFCSDTCKRRNNYLKYDVGEYVVTCPTCGQKRIVTRPPARQQTLCRKCRGRYIREVAPSPTGNNSPAWKGGRRIDCYGYIKLHKPGHPFADSTNYVREHIFVICETYGVDFFVRNGGTVHHINGDKQDNRIENLYVCTSKRNKQFTKDLLEISYGLVKKGIIEFIDGEYCCPLLSDELGETSQIR